MSKDFPRYTRGLKRLEESWRKPRGIHNKVRLCIKGKPKMPRIGYGTKKELKHKHPSGYEEVLVYNVKDLDKVDKEKQAIRIAKVGKKKKLEIQKKAYELGIKVLNPLR